ncbi:hypothetical protein BYT27DRAFT_7019673, partial [Phlegmacium glaucopus]
AIVKPKCYNLIVKFVPCTGTFDPNDADCVASMTANNNLPPGSIVSASWLKRVDHRSPSQKVASLRITCSSPEATNHLL